MCRFHRLALTKCKQSKNDDNTRNDLPIVANVV